MNKVNKLLCFVLAFAMMLIPMSVCAAPADGYTVALNLDADNTTVAPGDTITLSLTVDVADWSDTWGLPCFYLMYNDSIFAPASDFKTNKEALRAPMGDFGEYVLEDQGVNNTITTSNYNAVSKKFEAAGESATDYTGGVMMTFKVDTDAGYSTLTGINYTDADTVQIEFYLTVAEDATLGTYKVGLPHAAYDAGKAYFSCCTTGKSVRVGASAIDTSNAFVEITVAEPAPSTATVTYTDGVDGEEIFADQTTEVEIGAATPAFSGTPTRFGYTFAGWSPEVAATVTEAVTYTATWEVISLELSHWKNQIRFDTDSKGKFSGTFDARMLMTIDNFDEVFADVNEASGDIIEIGYLFNKGAAINESAAKTQVESGTGSYSKVNTVYVSTAFASQGKDYVMSCMIQNIPEDDKTLELSAIAYVVYTDANGDKAYAYSPVETSTFEELYNNNFSTAFPA